MCFAEELRSLLPDDLSPSVIVAISPPSIGDLIEIVADHYSVDQGAICDRTKRSARRDPNSQRAKRNQCKSRFDPAMVRLSLARHVICHFARAMTGYSHKRITLRLGGFNHTLSSKSGAAIAGRATRDELLRDDLDILRLRILDRLLIRCEGTWH